MTAEERVRYGAVVAGTGAEQTCLKPDQTPTMAHGSGWYTRLVKMTPEQAVAMLGPGQKMVFPKQVLLTLDTHEQILYPEGVHEVPQSLLEHQWFRLCGVKPVPEPQVREPIPERVGKENNPLWQSLHTKPAK